MPEAIGSVLVAVALVSVYAALFRRARMSGRVDRSNEP
jgi:hypothetical protein